MTRDRISRVTTRAGDKGTTKTATGKTLAKHHPLIRAVGSVDELNSHIGVLLTHIEATSAERSRAHTIQQALFDIGAVLTMEGEFDPPTYEELETGVEQLNAALPPLTEFVLPGGGPAAAQAHVCRTVCRRAETEIWALLEVVTHAHIEDCAKYLNRLSDYFFVLARHLTADTEQQWRGPEKK